MNRTKKHYIARGFTLVELLTVIAVLAILAGLMIPVVSGVRARAATTQCAANLRALAAAHALYRMENNGRGPPVAAGPSDPRSEGHNNWGFYLLRYYYMTGPRYIWTQSNTFISNPTEKCPSSSDFDPNNDPSTPDYNFGVKDVNYNQFFTNPPKTPLIWDGWVPKGNVTQVVPLRHQGGINMAFLDGHVEHLDGKDGRLYENYMWSLYNSGTPSNSNLGSGTPLGSTLAQKP